MGLVGPGFELRMVLDAHIEGPVGELHRLHQPPVGRKAGEGETMCRQHLPVIVVELIAVPVPLGDLPGAVAAQAASST